jgi:type II secretion system protein G
MKKKNSSFAFEKRQTQRGFTLMELLIVIAILGILATIGLGSFRSSQIKGRDAQRKSDLSQIQKALEMYYNDYGEYPESLPAGGSAWQDTKGTLYMKEVPKDPKDFNYCYEVAPNGSWYRLYAKLENEKDAGITKSGCSGGCTCQGDSTYNYKVTSSNAP